MGLPRYADKFRGCMAPTQAYGLLVPIGFLVAFALFSTYLPPWGEDQIRQALDLSADVDIGNLNASYIAENSCSGCVFGSNTQWPTNTTGTLNFLDSKAGTTASGVIATSLAGAAVIGTGTMLWASAMPSAAAALSFSGGFYEMTHIVEQAQFVGMISQLRIEGAPTFLLQFSKELSWTNFNLIKSSGGSSSGSGGDDRRLADSSSSGTGAVAAAGQSGPARYAALIGVDIGDLFFYTLITFVVVLAVIHVVYIILVLITGILAKNESLSGVARMWYRKVMWASVLALLLAQYVFSMAGSYLISSGSAGGSTPRYVLGSAALTAAILFALGLGIVVVGNNKGELKDVGTCEHDQRAFSSKYSVYYDEYNFDNRFFFVPRILLAVLTGIIVGVVHNATTQLKCILGITLVYLILLLIRQPNLLRLRFYIDSVSVFVKIVLISLLLIVARDDSFPQTVRDNVAYGIIGVNMFIFFLLFVRQGYTIIHKMIVACRYNKNRNESSSLDTMDIASLELGNTPSARDYQQVESTPAGRGPNWHETKPHHHQQPITQSSHDPNNFDNMPILEVPEEQDPVLTSDPSRTRGSHKQQYSSRHSSRATNANNASPTLAPVPEASVSARRVPLPASNHGPSRTNNETARSTLPREPSTRISVQPRPSSRPSTVPLTASTGSNLAGAVSDFSHHFSKKKHNLKVDDLHDNTDDDVEEDFVAEPPLPAPVRQQFAPGPSTARPQFNPGGTLQFTPGDSTSSTNTGIEHSYCNFADSGISTTSTSMNFSDSGISTSTYDFSDSAITTGSEIMGQSTVMTENTFSAAMEAIPSNRTAYDGDFGNNSHRKMSISSNDSGSFNGDSSRWFKQRSKTVVSDNSEAYETEDAGYDGPTVASAFSRRQSGDSYGYQSTVNYPSSHMNFNGESQVSHNQLDQTLRLKPSFDGYASAISMGADSFDGEYDPSQRRGTGSSNQSFISASSDGSADTLTDNEKSDRLPKGDRISNLNGVTGEREKYATKA
ncbi:hypothetical protein BBJ29_002939 [Phytophthora kernoviae]|uniref:TRP C-terminal domain-containing protein n=1 Tax=Phytophthora kernoviae TaxID=325452 RepID=A0A3F2S3Q2_9STRA|nr:hypothetical protein BBJ29_002939 [Phytophthora kernoviae]RLN69723.1 hypothetical protein BBP00_00000192 [Phytophthora kernoviae]